MGDGSDAADPAHLVEPLLARSFDAASLTLVRHEVAACAAASGLAGNPLDDFVLAVNELVTNAVRHGGGSGRLRLWCAEGQLVCEVSDQGVGIDGPTARDRDRPSPRVAGGWGLWLARELSDSMTVSTGADGTSVRITAATPR